MKKISAILVLILCFNALSFLGGPVYCMDSHTGFAKTLTGSLNTDAYDEYVSRGEFAEALLKLMNYPVDLDDVQLFNDVWVGSEYSQSINSVCNYGWMTGYKDGSFRPDEPVEMLHAIRSVIAATGQLIKLEGGNVTPGGYFSLAATLDLTDGIIITQKYLDRDSFDIFMSNALYVMIIDYSGNETGTVLEKCHALLEVEGIVTATSVSGIDCDSNLAENKIEIDGKVYKTEAYANDLLGFRVKAYAKITDSDSLVYVEKDPGSNKSLLVSADDFCDSKPSYGNFEYYKGDKTEKIKIDYSKLDVIYNGKAFPGYSVNDLYPKVGFVEFIDNNSDGNYEICKVDSYETYITDYINSEHYELYDKVNGKVLKIDTGKSDVKVFRLSGNEKVDADFSDIGPWDVVEVAVSKDNELFTLVITQNSVSGIVTEIGDGTVTVDNLTFETTDSFDCDVQPGDECELFLNINGKITGVNMADTKRHMYAWLINMSYNKTGVDRQIKFKLLSESGTIELLESADRVSINGYGTEDMQYVIDAIAPNGDFDGEFVKIRLNALRQIKEILTPQNPGTTIENALIEDFSKEKRANASLGRVHHSSGDFLVDSDTVIFSVPLDTSLASDSDYRITKDAVSEYNVSETAAYDVDDDGVAGAVVDYRKTYGLTNRTLSQTEMDNNGLFVVESVSKAIDSSGEEIYKINGYCDGEKSFIYVKEEQYDTFIKNIKGNGEPLGFGDFFIYVSDEYTGYISAMKFMFSTSDNTGYYSLREDKRNSNGASYLETAFGKIKDKGQGIKLAITSNDDPQNKKGYLLFADDVSYFVYIVDVEEKKVRIGTKNDLRTDSEVYMRVRCDVIKEAVVFE